MDQNRREEFSAKRSPIRIAILECDPFTPSICAKYGDYGGVMTTFFEDGARWLEPEPAEFKISSWNVQDYSEYPNLEDIDAILITGSSKSTSRSPFAPRYPSYRAYLVL